MTKKLIAVILGGASAERPVSLKTGAEVAKAIDREKYEVILLDGAKEDELKTLEGEKYPSFENYLSDPDSKKPDLAFLALHGSFGEDGGIQAYLDNLGLKYTFSGSKSSKLSMDKTAAKKAYEAAGIKIADEVILESPQVDVEIIVEKLGLPVVIKPIEQGSSFGVSIIKDREKVLPAIKEAFKYDKRVMLERYIRGVEITVATVGNSNPEAMPVIEIRPKGGSEFFDYTAKYSESGCDEICPATISDDLATRAQQIAKLAHKTLGCAGISRTDMIIEDKTNDIYTLETNTIPGMTPASLLPKAARAAGYSFPKLIEMIINLALEK
jgi:D-alanine-D-alanine ligase